MEVIMKFKKKIKIKNIKKKFKKFSISIFTFFVAFTALGLNPQEVQAASAPQKLYDIAGTQATVSQGLHSAWWADGIGKIQVDGEIAFCIEPTTVGLGGTYSKEDNIPIDIKLKASKIVYYGWDSTGKTDNDYATTQYMIWEAMGYNVVFNGTFGSQYPALKAKVQAKIDAHGTKPSFHSQNYEVNLGESITINDTNNVLNQFHVQDNGGAGVSISGNKIVITPTINTPENITVVIRKIPSKNTGASIAYRSSADDGQDVGVFKMADPNYANINIKVNKYVDVTVTKEDIETGATPQGDARLIGAEYSLYKKDGTFVETKTIGNDLKLKFEKLMATDEYYMKETKAPIGYLLNEEKIIIKPLELLNDGSVGSDLQYGVTSKEQVMKRPIEGHKFYSDGTSGIAQPLEGVEFTFKLKSEVDNVGWDNATVYAKETTNAKGYFKTKELPYGTYIGKETITPPNHIAVKDFEVVIDRDDRDPITYYLNNDMIKQYVRFAKLDVATDEHITLTSAEFEIFHKDGTQYKEKDGSSYKTSFFTNEEGVLELNKVLEAGEYYAVEQNTLAGFLDPQEKFEFVVDETNEIIGINEEDGYPIVEVKIYNERPTAELEITKTFEEHEEISDKVAGFEVRNGLLPVLSPVNGEVIYAPLQVIENPNSDDGLWYVKDGETIKIENLQFGMDDKLTLTVQEKVTSEDYKLDETIHTVTFTKEDNTTKIYTQTVDVENKLYHPTIGTKATGINNEKVLDPTIENTLVDVSDIKDVNPNKTYTIITRLHEADGTVIMERVYEDVTFEEADAKFTSELTLDANTLKEGNYYFSETMYEKGKDNPIEDTPVAEHNDPNDEGQTIRMEKFEYTIHANKTDAITGQNIKNSKFKFEFEFYKDGKVVKTENVNGTKDTGIATLTFKGTGEYDEIKIKEVEAPDGYYLSKEVKIVKMADFNKDKVYSFTYDNERMPAKVVKAGDTSDTQGFLAMIGLSGIFVAFMIANRYNRKEKKNVE